MYGQLILIFFNNELYCSVKNCVNNDVLGSEIYHNIRKEWIEQVIWKTNTQFLYAVNILTKIVIETKIAKYSEMVQFPLYLKWVV